MTLATAFLSLLTSVDPAGLATAAPAPVPPVASTMIEATVEEAGTNAHELTPTDAALTLTAADAATVPTIAPAEPEAAAPDPPAPTPAVQLALHLDLDESAASPAVEASPPSTSVQLAFAFQDEAPATEGQAEVPAAAAPQPNERGEPPIEPVEEELIEGRRRPDIERDRPDAVEQDNPGAIRSPPPEAFPADHIPIPDRWRLIESLGRRHASAGATPINQNTLKGDRPLCTPDRRGARRAAGHARLPTPVASSA